ncbi:hypothetical protein BKA69DRAFT_1044228 [Paraphysoderma sedebokerense]|nr:hypothetical protein BKA69DRAFT_1044228 [Paraphysoderma sedebokerense]
MTTDPIIPTESSATEAISKVDLCPKLFRNVENSNDPAMRNALHQAEQTFFPAAAEMDQDGAATRSENPQEFEDLYPSVVRQIENASDQAARDHLHKLEGMEVNNLNAVEAAPQDLDLCPQTIRNIENSEDETLRRKLHQTQQNFYPSAAEVSNTMDQQSTETDPREFEDLYPNVVRQIENSADNKATDFLHKVEQRYVDDI